MAVSSRASDDAWLRVPIYAILLFETAALIVRSYFDVQMQEYGFDANLAADLSYLVVPPLLLLLMYPVVKEHGYLIKRLYRLENLNTRSASIGAILGAILFLASLATNVVLSAYDITARDAPLLAMRLDIGWACTSFLYLILGIAVSAVLIPFIEETINRGFLLHFLLPRGRLLAVVLTSLFFAIFHDPDAIPSAFVIGIYFSYLTLNSGTLWPATIAHVVHNFLVRTDNACMDLTWDGTSTHGQIAQTGFSAIVAMLLLLFAAAILVSRKATGAQSAPL